jgi:very-short-patch-repair endonuclease
MDAFKELMRKVEREHGIVTRDELLGAGLSERQITRWLRTGRLIPVAHGVYRMAGSPATFESEVMGAIRVFDGDTYASHHTAARLWGIPIYGRERRIELTRPTDLSAQRSVARVHRSTALPKHHLTVSKAIPVTTAARTVFDLARTTGPMRLHHAVDVATREDITTIGALYRVVFEIGGRGRPGTRRMRQVLDEFGEDYVPTESELDAIGRAVLAYVAGIKWQVPMSDEQGYIRRVDGLHAASKLVVEFDGAKFHDTPRQKTLDKVGDRRLRAMGHEVKRYRWLDVTRDADRVRSEVLRWIERAAA